MRARGVEAVVSRKKVKEEHVRSGYFLRGMFTFTLVHVRYV